jgi:hypothetical protein
MLKPVLITLIVVLGVLGLAEIGQGVGRPEDVVYEVCNASRIHDIVSEQTCGELQDYYHLEFLCDKNNKLADNHCWVEKV